MPDNSLDQLLKKAISLQIEGLEGVGHSISVQTLIEILTQIQRSFNNYIEIGVSKNPELAKGKDITPELIALIQEKLQLLVLKVQPGSVVVRMSPDTTNLQGLIFTAPAVEWQSTVFDKYKTEVISPAYTPSFIDDISDKYNPEERTRIYKPFFKAVGLGQEKTSYRINLIDNDYASAKINVIKTLSLPEKKDQKAIIPNVRPVSKVEEMDGLVLARIKTTNGKSHVTNIYSVNETFTSIPYSLETIRYKHRAYTLTKKIVCQLRKEEETFFLEYKDLDIEVWGSNLGGVVEACGFAFDSLYRNFVKVKEEELSPQAIVFRHKLAQLVKGVV